MGSNPTGPTFRYTGPTRSAAFSNPGLLAFSDDWYFVRLSTREPLAFGSEKNCYIEADIGKIWNEYERLVDKAHFDKEGRAVVNVRWIVRSAGVISLTTVMDTILLKRDSADKSIVTKLSADEALQYMIANDFCNPHQLVKDQRKLELRKDFFRRYFKQTNVYMVNTIMPPQETQQKIREMLNVSDSL
ncbi:hypothetical protein KEJ34_03590 [Candidatus Bathyarchaeota archaeon]|nr:hypothetical protein [Candidatus Bathyarchaeota archaeon]